MWPPSSGRTGRRFRRPSARLISARTFRKYRRPARQASRRDAHDPDGARDLIRVAPGRETSNTADCLGRDAPRLDHGVACRRGRRLAGAGTALDPDPDHVHAAARLRTQRAENDALAVAPDDQPEWPALRGTNVRGDVVGLHRLARDPQDAVARADVRGRGRAALDDPPDDVRVLVRGDHEEAGKEDDREDEVDCRAGEDRRQPAPRGLPPVRVRCQRPLELLPHACLAEHRLQLRQVCTCGLVVLTLDRVVEARELRAVSLTVLRAQRRRQVARRRAVHAGDLDVTAERDRADPVFDTAARGLRDRGSEAEVELARRHPDGARGEEVAGLVDHHEECKPDDPDDYAHTRSTASRARESASRSSSRSRAGEPSVRSRASSTDAAMSRNPIRPSRNAATATSFAALNAQG